MGGAVSLPPGGDGRSSAAVNVNTAQHLQKVIETQRTQIALFSQIAQLVTEQKSHFPGSTANSSSGGGGNFPPTHSGHMTSHSAGHIGPAKGIATRTQTFDYGNQSNKVLETVAAHQLERDYCHGNGNTWS